MSLDENKAGRFLSTVMVEQQGTFTNLAVKHGGGSIMSRTHYLDSD